MIFDRYIHTNDVINGVANYLNNHGYTKKLRQNGTIPGFSASFIKKIIDNPVYMGKMEIGFRILSFSFQCRLLKKARQ